MRRRLYAGKAGIGRVGGPVPSIPADAGARDDGFLRPAVLRMRSGTRQDRRVVSRPARPRIVPQPLDDTSKRIIEQLQEDGRRPYAAIGKAVGLSEAAVRQRVQRLRP
jgi:hypothetical protein